MTHKNSPILLSVALVACIWIVSAASPVDQVLTHISIETPKSPLVAEQLTLAGFDVLEGSISERRFELIVSDAELEALLDKGLETEIIALGRPFKDIQSERATVLAVPSHYPDLGRIIAEMNSAEVDFPSICKVVELTETYGLPATFEGRHIFAVKISDNVDEDEDEPACLMVCEHHAREIVAPVIALYAIERFTTQYGTDPRITALVDEHEIWIAPVWNPDGYAYVFNVNNLWRKNRRVFEAGTGVDLNRNYPFAWDSPCSGSVNVASGTYRGPVPGSEAETQTMIAFAEDRHFAKVADFHSYGREVRYGYGCLSYPFDSFLVAEAENLAAGVPGYATSRSCCTAGDIHFQMASRGTYAFLWETHTRFQPSYASARAEAALVFPGCASFIERPIPLSGCVTDACASRPVVASIEYVGINFENGETNYSDERFGRYHAFLPEGKYTIEFSAVGYLTQSHVVDVDARSAAFLDVALIPQADLDSDGDVDMVDFALFSLVWKGKDSGGYGAADLTGDGKLDVDDVQEFAGHWLAGK
jgi:hypothetical protein